MIIFPAMSTWSTFHEPTYPQPLRGGEQGYVRALSVSLSGGEKGLFRHTFGCGLATRDTAQRGQAATKSSSSSSSFSSSIAPFPITRTTTRTRTRNSRSLRRFGQILIDWAVCATTTWAAPVVAQTALSAVSPTASRRGLGGERALFPQRRRCGLATRDTAAWAVCATAEAQPTEDRFMAATVHASSKIKIKIMIKSKSKKTRTRTIHS